jgi:hypothetical protein
MTGYDKHRSGGAKAVSTYGEFDSLLTGRNRDSKKLNNNTDAIRHEGIIAIKLHDTDIVTFYPDGDIKLNSGGWRTPTTKDRIQTYSPYRISQERGVWRIGGVVFADNMTFHLSGAVTGAGKDNSKADKKFKARVKKFAELCASEIPLEMPSNGDCWYCYMVVSDCEDKSKIGLPLGEANHDKEHLESHISEGYVVPSLVLRALKLAGCGDLILHYTFTASEGNHGKDLAAGYVKRSVYRYILKQFGYAV